MGKVIAIDRINIGDKFNFLVVIDKVKVKNKGRQLKCECKCGKITILPTYKVISGHTKSCGCYFKEYKRTGGSTHGKSYSSEYIVWRNILGRCENKKHKGYPFYGGRGISVCEDWHNFSTFYMDMGDKPSKNHSIDRIDNNKNYCKDNCRWATIDVQNRNKRSNINITYKGQTLNLAEWARKLNIHYDTLLLRWKRMKGVDIDYEKLFSKENLRINKQLTKHIN